MKSTGVMITEELNWVKDNFDQTGADINTTLIDTFSKINLLYNSGSAAEDVIFSHLAAIGSTLSSAKYAYDQYKRIFMDDFGTYDIYDKNFHVDTELFLDRDNKALTLPVLKTGKSPIVSAIIEPDSNGTPGNSLDGYTNNDINAIIANDASSYFEYEKFLDVYSYTPLRLTLTLKIDVARVVNGIFIKMTSSEDVKLADIEKASYSPDGVTWTDIPFNFVDNKTDKFIRFSADTVRYVKLNFVQKTYQPIQTKFGTRNRYVIGLRYIEIQSIEYGASGEYVSIPFKPGFPMTSMLFQSQDISSGTEIAYYFSLNNGGKWTKVAHGETVNLLAIDTGLPMGVDADQLRVKIAMNRQATSVFSDIEEILPASPQGRYVSKYKPLTASLYAGGLFSYGDKITPMATVINWNTQSNANFKTPMCALSSAYKINLPLLKYSDKLINYITVNINGTDITRAVIDDYIGTVDISNDENKVYYNVLPGRDKNSSVLLMDLVGLSIKLNKPDLAVSGMVTVGLKEFRVTRQDIRTIGQTFTLPAPTLHKDKKSFSIRSTAFTTLPQGLITLKDGSEYTVSYSLVSATGDNGSVIPNGPIGQMLDLSWASTITMTTDTQVLGFENAHGLLVTNNNLDTNGNPLTIPDPNYASSVYGYVLTPDGTADGLAAAPKEWVVFSGRRSQDGVVTYVPVAYESGVEWTSSESRYFTLPLDSECKYDTVLFVFVGKSDTDTIKLKGLHLSEKDANNAKTLNVNNFDIIDRNTIFIRSEAFYPASDYYISYTPAIDVSEFLPTKIMSNILDIPLLSFNDSNVRLALDYTYQSISSLGSAKYSSPVCNWYKVSVV